MENECEEGRRGILSRRMNGGGEEENTEEENEWGRGH